MQDVDSTLQADAPARKRSRRWIWGAVALGVLLWIWSLQATCDPWFVGTWTLTRPSPQIGYQHQWHFSDIGIVEKTFFIGPSKRTSGPLYRWRTQGNELAIFVDRRGLGGIFGDVERLWQRARGVPTQSRFLVERISDTELVLTPAPGDWPGQSKVLSFRREPNSQ